MTLDGDNTREFCEPLLCEFALVVRTKLRRLLG